jgi:hypothetical protein
MRIINVALTAFRSISSKLDMLYDKDGKSLLVYREND